MQISPTELIASATGVADPWAPGRDRALSARRSSDVDAGLGRSEVLSAAPVVRSP